MNYYWYEYLVTGIEHPADQYVGLMQDAIPAHIHMIFDENCNLVWERNYDD